MIFFKSKNRLICILRGVLESLIFTLIMLTIYSALLVYTNLSEQTMKTVIITITGISILIGSSIESRKIHKNGLINGALIGTLYMFSIYLISSILSSNFELNWISIIMIVIGIIGGTIGGIIGVIS